MPTKEEFLEKLQNSKTEREWGGYATRSKPNIGPR